MKSPRGYFLNIIAPTYAEHSEDPANLRRAILACMVAYHYVDSVEAETGEPAQEAYARFLKECPSFQVVRAVSVAGKHIVARSAGNITIDDIMFRPHASWDEAGWDGSVWDDGRGAVIVEGNPDWDVTAALEQVIGFISHQVAE